MDPNAIQFFDHQFQIHDDKFDYANVSSIRWRWIERIKFIYFVPIGASYTYELSIEFVTGSPLDLGIGAAPVPAFLSSALNKRNFEALEMKIKRLLDETREYRLASYRDQMRRESWFEYDGKAFYADGSVLHNGRRRALDFKSRAQATAIATKLKCIPSGSLVVSTLWDRDCFHSMLSEIHGAVSSKPSMT